MARRQRRRFRQIDRERQQPFHDRRHLEQRVELIVGAPVPAVPLHEAAMLVGPLRFRERRDARGRKADRLAVGGWGIGQRLSCG